MKNLILKGLVSVLAFVFTITIQSSAQTEPRTFTAKKAVYVEFGGSSGRYAINHSNIFHQKGKLKLNASVGFSMYSK